MRGHRVWVIPEGYIPGRSFSDKPELISHEAACLLNVADTEARVEITLYFEDREPAGPYRVDLPARRTKHLRFNDLDSPEKVPRDKAYASMIRANAPIFVQHTRLDSRDPHIAIMTTMAFPVTE